MPGKLLALAWLFAPLSFLTIGGGQAIVPALQRQVVAHHWMTATEFLNAFAVSRMAPGPGSLLATLIGWRVAGLAGAVVATISMFAPTAFMIYGVAHLWGRYRGANWQIVMERGLRPVAAGMILAGADVLLRSLEGGWGVWMIAAASTVLLMTTRAPPLALIAGGAAISVVLNTVLGG